EVNIKTDVPILDLSNIQRKIKTKKDLKAFIQQLIDEATAKNSSASAETRDGHKVQLADKVKTKNHGTYKVAQHIAYSSNKMQPKQREFIVSNIYDLIEYSFFVDEAIEKKDKIGYDKVYRYMCLCV
ncbi:MAG: hypothetical protein J5706_07815, partial [Elusimicrobiales bacterium]|nr:hypothetical protein [Elusimicrobiales bacterium]